MIVSPTQKERSWDGALLEAARRLPSENPHSQLFLEEREDLRVEAGEDGVRETAQLFLSGLAGRGGRDGRSEAAIPAPSPRDAASMARAVARDDVPIASAGHVWVGPERWLDPHKAGEVVSELVTDARKAVGNRRSFILARWVSFEQRIWVAAPVGGVIRDRRVGRRVRVEVRLAGGRGAATGVAEAAFGERAQPGLEAVARQAARRAHERLRSRAAPAGKLPAVFAPGVGGIVVHELVGHALEADTVRRGASALAALSGRVASKEVRILDDPRRGRAPWRVDDEGALAREVVLIRGGKVAGLLHDRRSATAMGVVPNGHGRRSSFQEPVRPRMGCTFLAQGRHDPVEAREGIARGVYVRRMEAASTDTSRGEMTFRVTDADLIHRGRLDSPLEPFLLTLTMREALSTIERISADLAFDTCIGSCMRDGQPLATSVGAPTFRIGLTTVTS